MKNFNNEPNYANYPPEIRKLLAIPGVNKEKALAWFNLGIDEPQTFNQALLLAEAVGYSPEQAKVVAAQWQMESAGGQNVGGAFNYFGIKSHSKEVRDALIKRGINVSAADSTGTFEYENGQKKSQKSSFMNFNNAFEAFAGHKAFLETNDRYKDIWNSKTAKDFAAGLEKAGYATAPNYGETLYNNYIKPKENNPASGDIRPKNWGAPVSSGENTQIFSNATYEEIGNIAPAIVPITPLPRLDQLPPTFLDTTTVDNLGVQNLNIQQFPSLIPTVPKTNVGRLPAINPQANGGILYAQGGTMNFKSPAAYKAWLAYGHASGEFAKTPGNQNITINNKPHKVQHNMGGSLLMRYANGGQLTEFANGGSHEENPIGGIPLGMANDGRQNLVEQNETKDNVKDYIFSERNKIDKKLAKEFDLPKSYVGKSFAEASKLANRVNSKRDKDWDSITANAIRRDLDKLITAQETFKQREEAKDLEMMMQKHPDLMNSLMSQGTPQSINPTMDPSQMPIDPQAMDAMTSPSAMPTSEVPMAYGGHMYEFGGNINKGNVKNMEGLSRGLGVASQVAGLIPGPWGMAASMALGAGQQLTNAAVGKASERIAGEQQDMLMAQQNPNVTTSGIPVEQNAYTAPNMNMLGMPNPTGMPVNTGLPNMAAYGGKLFAMGDFLGDPPPSSSIGPINYYAPTLPSDYLKTYAADLQAYKNNPKNAKGIPMQGAGTAWAPITEEQRAARIAKLEALSETDLHSGTLEDYLTLKEGKPFFIDTENSDLTLRAPYDLSNYKAKPKPIVPAATPRTEFYMLDANTGQPVYDNGIARKAPEGAISDIQYSQYLEQFANSPEQINKRNAIEREGAINTNLLKQLTQEQKAEMRGLKLTPQNYVKEKELNILPFDQAEPITFGLGGNLYAGGGYRKMELEGDLEGNKRMDTSLEDIKQNIDLRQTPMEALGNAASIGYNLYQGLSPVDTIQARELYTPLVAPKVDYTQAENQARSTGAGFRKSLQNAGANPSNFLANYGNVTSAIAGIQTEEENRNKMLEFETDKINAAAKAAATWQALQTNWGMQTARQEHIKQGFKDFKDYQQRKREDEVALAAAGLANPDAMRLYNFQTGPFYEKYLEQIKANREAKKNSKNKTEE